MVRRAEPVFREMTESGYERIAVVTHEALSFHDSPLPGKSTNKWRILGKNLENCSITELNWDAGYPAVYTGAFNDYAIWSPIPICCERDGSVLKVGTQVLYGFRVMRIWMGKEW